jgi:hypothetical protein
LQNILQFSAGALAEIWKEMICEHYSDIHKINSKKLLIAKIYSEGKSFKVFDWVLLMIAVIIIAQLFSFFDVFIGKK